MMMMTESPATGGKYLCVGFPDEETAVKPHTRFLPFAASGLQRVEVKRARVLAQGPDVKTAYELTLNVKSVSFDYKPGDAIGVLPRNDPDEVGEIIQRLGLAALAGKPYSLTLPEGSSKKVPKHLPVTGTIAETLLGHLDVRSVPKKLFLKGLLDYTTDEADRQKLAGLTNPKTGGLYQDFIAQLGNSTLIGLLKQLPSCTPSIGYLFESLPPLQPRYYSIASSPLLQGELVIAFSVVEFTGGSKGVCTGWLERCAHSSEAHVEFYFRNSGDFLRLDDPDKGVIMVGPGTGVAPFIGLLQDRFLRNNPDTGSSGWWLYFGCRYPDQDDIYQEELQTYLERKVLGRLRVAFSRTDRVHVQDKLEEDGEELVQRILTGKATVSVCGDAKHLATSVQRKLESLLVKYAGMTGDQAEGYLKEMRADNRFQLDIWL